VLSNNIRPWRQINELHLHVTTACNLRCGYCYADTDVKNRGRVMSDEMARAAIDEVLDQTDASVIQIIFHGGEPLLRSESFYENICAYAEARARNKGLGLSFGMQTNLTLLTETMADLLSKYRVKIGTSIDGPQNIHNSYRGLYSAVINGVALAKRFGIFCGPIVVVHRHNYDRMKDVLDNFRELGIFSVHCNVGAAVGRGTKTLQRLNAKQIFIAFSEIFEYMLSNDFAIVDTRVLMMVERQIYRRYSQDRALLNCSTPFCHAGITLIAVDVDGSVFPCGCASADDSLMPFRIAQIGSRASYDRDRLLRFHEKPTTYETICADCPARFVCYHGCPAFDATDAETAFSICQSNRLSHDFLSTRSSDIQRYRTFLENQGINRRGHNQNSDGRTEINHCSLGKHN